MKFAMNSETELKNVPGETNEMHLIRPIKHSILIGVLKKCGNLNKMTLSKSCFNRLPSKSKKLLKENQVDVKIESRKGRPLSLNLDKIREIVELAKDEQSFREIERITKVPKSTAHYLVRYANRGKVKKGNTILYLK